MITGKFIKSGEDVSVIMDIRYKVFVEEQGFPADKERDEYDDMSIYALVRDEEGTAASTGRLFMDMDDNMATIGRVCTLKEYRYQGLGDLVMRMLLYRVLEMNLPRVKLSAQVSAMNFYARYGFHPVGEPYPDDGVMHQTMIAENSEINIEGTCHCCAKKDGQE